MKLSYILFFFLTFKFLSAQEWETPVINGYGEIKYFKDAAEQPDPSLEYNLIFDIKDAKEKNGVNKGLWSIARLLNMFSVASVPNDKTNIVVAIHGEATYVVLSDEKHKNQFEKPNPNLDLLKQLKESGVKLYVCSQATAARNISNKDLNPYITPALSAMSVLSNYQIKGYSLMP
jgi:intracellular sulfur oxidation DsrE/DsrF family protein